MLFNGVFFGVYVAAIYKDVALKKGSIQDSSLTVAGALGSFMNGSSRIMWASLQDYFGFRAIYMILLIIQLITAVTLYSAKDSTIVYSSLLCLSFLCEGGHFSTFPAAAVKLYGIQEGGKIFTISFFAVPLSSMLGFVLAHYVKSADEQTILYFGGFLTFTNIILLMAFDEDEIKIEYKDSNGFVINEKNYVQF